MRSVPGSGACARDRHSGASAFVRCGLSSPLRYSATYLNAILRIPYIFSVNAVDDWVGWFRTRERPAVGTTAEGVSSGVLPAGLLGLFPRRRSDAKRKSPNRLWLFRGRKCRGYATGLELPTGASLFRRGRDTLRNSKMCPFCFLPLPFVRRSLRGGEVSFLLPVVIQVFVVTVKNGLVDHFGRG